MEQDQTYFRNLFFWTIITTLTIISCQREYSLTENDIINTSVSIQQDTYYLDGKETLDSSILTISGEDIVVDFQGSVIIGSTDYTRPDLFSGLGISIRDGKNITIRNLHVRGFKVGLMAVNVPGLVIENCDFSYNYRPRLWSIREREDFADWLSYHHNEEDEWLRFGAGIYLKNCNQAVFSGNFISQNQNALLMAGCDSSLIINNIFVFNSGLGLGLYRSSHNRILHNCLDFNIRGYSHGFYRRGQDSAGALFYEQSSDNIFAYNSATHSGDGFFLWAGQETMDSGEGGCNGNMIINNDFSFAPTNGIEVTFSSNIIIGNKMEDCRYGIWGGYSYDTYISDNHFRDNHYGIAIEHGNNNTIVNNQLTRDSIGIQLWQRETQPSGWGFAEKRDVSSRDYVISGNVFTGVKTKYDIRHTMNVDTTSIDNPDISLPKPLTNGMDAIGKFTLTGRDKMMINEWGPYNFIYPEIWLTAIKGNKYHFKLMAPGGNWEMINAKGFGNTSSTSGSFPAEIMAEKLEDAEDLWVELKYNGPPFQDQFGVQHDGKDFIFRFGRFEKEIEWEMKFYNYSHDEDLVHRAEDFESFIRGTADAHVSYKALGIPWWRSPATNIDADYFITLGTATATFDPGEYRIEVSSDDGVRLYLDGNLIIDHWEAHESAVDTVNVHLDGAHELMLEHYELTGFSTLDFRIAKL